MNLRFVGCSLIARFNSTLSNSELVKKLSQSPQSKFLGNISSLLDNSPELARYTSEQWETSMEVLKQLGFNEHKFTQMILKHPVLLSRPKEKIENSLNNWLFLNLGKKTTIQLLERYPELLELKDFHHLNENLNIVKNFVGQKHGYKILRNSPNLVTDSSKSINEKVNYLRNEMKIDPVEVYKSDVFSIDITTLKTRHLFLERLGMWFGKKKRDERVTSEIKKNPKLSQISDSSDKRFATKICHVTLEEYEAFKDMIKEELDNTEDLTKGDENFHQD